LEPVGKQELVAERGLLKFHTLVFFLEEMLEEKEFHTEEVFSNLAEAKKC
jgi:hypothetical protein